MSDKSNYASLGEYSLFNKDNNPFLSGVNANNTQGINTPGTATNILGGAEVGNVGNNPLNLEFGSGILPNFAGGQNNVTDPSMFDSLGDWFTDGDNLSGLGSVAKGAAGLWGAYNGNKQLGYAKDQMDWQMDMGNKNYTNSVAAYNNQRTDNYNKRKFYVPNSVDPRGVQGLLV